MKILSSLILLLIILPAGFSSGQDILPFEPDDTLEEIRYKIDHNGYSFEVSDNWVFDMSPAEKSRFFSRRGPAFARALTSDTGIGPLESRLGTVTLPTAFDWRNHDGHDYIGEVRNQGNCGSCYAFGATAAAEGSYNWITGNFDGNRADFSEAFIAFCLSDHYSGFDGCNGASYDYDELQALVDYGICTETEYPYSGQEQSCPLTSYPPLTQFQSWHRVPCNDIDAIKTAIMTYGVVDAAVVAAGAFSAYNNGIYQDTNTVCDGTPCAYTTSDHAISLVGWDDNPPEGGGGVWILRNSWGPSWGESGYMRIRYTSAVVGCAVAYLVYQPPTSPTPTPFGYKTPTPTPSATPTPEGFKTPTPSPAPSATASTAPQSIPFTEDFEGAWSNGVPEGWSKKYLSGTTDWEQAEGNGYSHPPQSQSGTYNALFYCEDYNQPITRLISPPLYFGGQTANTRLNFWLAMEEWLGDQDELSIYYRTSAGAAWNLLTTLNSSISTWTEHNIDLPNPSNDYYICLQGTANWGYGICIDDLLVTGEAGAPATPTPTAAGIAPSPTPTTTGIAPSPTPTCGPAISQPNFLIATGDYDGDGRADPAIFRDTTGLWAVRGITRVYFGSVDDSPVSGDYNGDGTTDIAIFRPSAGLWAISGISRIYYGSTDDFPCPADYDGDGSADVATFQTENGRWAVRGITRVYFGESNDRPLPGDYTGDGTANIAIFRPSSGLWALRDISRVYFGATDDWPLRIDYDGNGTSDIGIFRHGAGGLWAIQGVTRVYYGNCLDRPIPADYRSTGIDDIGIFRETSGLWAIKGITRIYFGSTSDLPVTR